MPKRRLGRADHDEPALAPRPRSSSARQEALRSAPSPSVAPVAAARRRAEIERPRQAAVARRRGGGRRGARGRRPSVTMANQALSACMRHARERALALLGDMRARSARAARAQLRVVLRRDPRGGEGRARGRRAAPARRAGRGPRAPRVDIVSFNATIAACTHTRPSGAARRVARHARARSRSTTGVAPDIVTHNARGRARARARASTRACDAGIVERRARGRRGARRRGRRRRRRADDAAERDDRRAAQRDDVHDARVAPVPAATRRGARAARRARARARARREPRREAARSTVRARGAGRVGRRRARAELLTPTRAAARSAGADATSVAHV